MRDWGQMGRGDFDESAPLALVDERAARVGVRVPAAPDAYGTAALFSDDVPVRPVARRAQAERPRADTLF
ncbi:hypothetical protein [Streptomyces griseocarneus]|uniref:hypothetical protein n=1 Tax=Streptomyces griseocarneus TaxID=51201 RepID=UPI0019A2D870|nr:hypothetical protein [Streptomyces griseocarneus]MBZ6476747.1 hypothetical protein [Streptomyces griseocarneus]GHG80692.1 hypothetical protein GCM10018779_62470 [Streptomyces griseocarneus]